MSVVKANFAGTAGEWGSEMRQHQQYRQGEDRTGDTARGRQERCTPGEAGGDVAVGGTEAVHDLDRLAPCRHAGARGDGDDGRGDCRNQEKRQTGAGLEAACQRSEAADPDAVTLDQRAWDSFGQATCKAVQLDIRAGQADRDDGGQRESKAFGAAAKPGSQELTEFVIAQRVGVGNARVP